MTEGSKQNTSHLLWWFSRYRTIGSYQGYWSCEDLLQ